MPACPRHVPAVSPRRRLHAPRAVRQQRLRGGAGPRLGTPGPAPRPRLGDLKPPQGDVEPWPGVPRTFWTRVWHVCVCVCACVGARVGVWHRKTSGLRILPHFFVPTSFPSPVARGLQRGRVPSPWGRHLHFGHVGNTMGGWGHNKVPEGMTVALSLPGAAGGVGGWDPALPSPPQGTGRGSSSPQVRAPGPREGATTVPLSSGCPCPRPGRPPRDPPGATVAPSTIPGKGKSRWINSPGASPWRAARVG